MQAQAAAAVAAGAAAAQIQPAAAVVVAGAQPSAPGPDQICREPDVQSSVKGLGDFYMSQAAPYLAGPDEVRDAYRSQALTAVDEGREGGGEPAALQISPPLAAMASAKSRRWPEGGGRATAEGEVGVADASQISAESLGAGARSAAPVLALASGGSREEEARGGRGDGGSLGAALRALSLQPQPSIAPACCLSAAADVAFALPGCHGDPTSLTMFDPTALAAGVLGAAAAAAALPAPPPTVVSAAVPSPPPAAAGLATCSYCGQARPCSAPCPLAVAAAALEGMQFRGDERHLMRVPVCARARLHGKKGDCEPAQRIHTTTLHSQAQNVHCTLSALRACK